MSTIIARDKWIPWYFVAFFGVVIAVNALMATLAIKTQTGVVSEHPYEIGLAYNKIVHEADGQARLGWKGMIDIQTNHLTFVLRNKERKDLILQNAVAHFSRPTQAGFDFDVNLTPGDTGYQAWFKLPEKGVWDVRIYARSHGKAYQQAKRVVIE